MKISGDGPCLESFLIGFRETARDRAPGLPRSCPWSPSIVQNIRRMKQRSFSFFELPLLPLLPRCRMNDNPTLSTYPLAHPDAFWLIPPLLAQQNASPKTFGPTLDAPVVCANIRLQTHLHCGDAASYGGLHSSPADWSFLGRRAARADHTFSFAFHRASS